METHSPSQGTNQRTEQTKGQRKGCCRWPSPQSLLATDDLSPWELWKQPHSLQLTVCPLLLLLQIVKNRRTSTALGHPKSQLQNQTFLHNENSTEQGRQEAADGWCQAQKTNCLIAVSLCSSDDVLVGGSNSISVPSNWARKAFWPPNHLTLKKCRCKAHSNEGKILILDWNLFLIKSFQLLIYCDGVFEFCIDMSSKQGTGEITKEFTASQLGRLHRL